MWELRFSRWVWERKTTQVASAVVMVVMTRVLLPAMWLTTTWTWSTWAWWGPVG